MTSAKTEYTAITARNPSAQLQLILLLLLLLLGRHEVEAIETGTVPTTTAADRRNKTKVCMRQMPLMTAAEDKISGSLLAVWLFHLCIYRAAIADTQLKHIKAMTTATTTEIILTVTIAAR